LEVFRMIGRGRSTKEIADELKLSVKTVEAYRAHIKEKLQISSALELVQRATLWVERDNSR
jgi:DNA-binding CsgD family transcriptional regulator